MSRIGRIQRFSLAFVTGAMVFTPAAISSTIIPLTVPSGYSTGEGEAINASGQVAVTLYKGEFESSASATALYSGGGFIDVAAGNGIGGGTSTAYGINDSGAQVGYYSSGLAATMAILISPSGGIPTNLKNLYVNNQSDGSEAHAINDSGIIVGSSYTTNNGAVHPVSWNSTGTVVTDLGTLSGGAFGTAFAINATGEIVGTAGASDDGLSNGHAFMYTTAGHIAAVSGLTGFSDAYGVNNSGEIVGDETIAGNLNAFLDNAGIVTDLGTLEETPARHTLSTRRAKWWVLPIPRLGRTHFCIPAAR